MKTHVRIAASVLTVCLLATPAFAASTKEEIQSLKDQIQQLTSKVKELETCTKEKADAQAKAVAVKKKKKKKPAAAVPAPRVVPIAAAAPAATPAPCPNAENYVKVGDYPGSIKIPGTNTSVKIGGYVKLDAIETVGSGYDQPHARFYMLPLSTNPVSDRSAQTVFTAQQTRLNFETRTPSSLGEVKTFVEVDFYGASGANSNTSGYGLELRHAYGSVGDLNKNGVLLAGQTWSNFMDTSAMPETLDYIGPAGTVFLRQPQIRYTKAVGKATLSASIEVPADVAQASQFGATLAKPTTAGTTVTTRTQFPDVVLRADYAYAADGYVSFRGVVNQINIDHNTISDESTETKYGYGLALSARQTVFGKDAVMFNIVGGTGTGRYDYDVNAQGVYYDTASGTVKAQSYYAGTIGYQHVWNDVLRSNVFGGAARIINKRNLMNGTALGFANKYVTSGHVNLIWQPMANYKVGLEYMGGYREVENGTEGSIHRFEASFIYSF